MLKNNREPYANSGRLMLGLTTPGVMNRVAAPSSPLAQTQYPVHVTSGGVGAPVAFAGLVSGQSAYIQRYSLEHRLDGSKNKQRPEQTVENVTNLFRAVF
jgi:hypothetical protein